MQPDPAAQPGAGGHHQLQEEAWMQRDCEKSQHQLHIRNSWKEEQSQLFSMSTKACPRTNGCILHRERFRLGTASNGEENKAGKQTARGPRILHDRGSSRTDKQKKRHL